MALGFIHVVFPASWFWSSSALYATAIAIAVTAPAAIVVRYIKGTTKSLLFVLATVLLMIAVIYFCLMGLGLVKASWLGENSIALGAAFESILATFAVADQVRSMRKERKSLEVQTHALRHASITDKLTELYNRRHFDHCFNELAIKAQNGQGHFSLLLMDADHFKSINDHYGHATGDQVLRKLAEVVTKTTRSDDVPCRYGGEEFAILLPDVGLAEANQIAERMRSEVEDLVLTSSSGKTFSSTASFSVAVWETGDTTDSLFNRADKQLYLAKSSGRNKVVFEL